MRAFILFALLASGLSCRITSAPELRGDIYVLRSVAGQDVPTGDSENPNSRVRVLAESIAFSGANAGEKRAAYDSPSGRWTVRTPFSFTQFGDRVEIALRCDDNASCIAPPHYVGLIASEELLVDHSNVSRVPRRYELVARR